MDRLTRPIHMDDGRITRAASKVHHDVRALRSVRAVDREISDIFPAAARNGAHKWCGGRAALMPHNRNVRRIIHILRFSCPSYIRELLWAADQQKKTVYARTFVQEDLNDYPK